LLKSNEEPSIEDPNFKDINDLNFQDKEHPKPKTVENKLGSNHTAPTGDPLNGKHRFEGLIERVTWKAECVKLSEMTNNRKTQLVKIFKIYGGLSIPYSHFTVERSKIKSLSNSQIFPVICAYHIGCFDKLENELTLKKDYVKDFSQYFLEIDKLVENKSRQHKLPAELTKLENCGLVSIIDQIVDEVGGNWNDWEIRNAYDVSRELTIMGPDGGKYRIKLWGKAVGDGYVCIEMRGDKRAMERLKRDLSIEKLIRRDNCFYPTKFGSKGQRTKDVNELKQRINKLKTIAQASAVDMLDVDIKKFLSECY
jgi:hypothetical protein